jgi:hypothetical protein
MSPYEVLLIQFNSRVLRSENVIMPAEPDVMIFKYRAFEQKLCIHQHIQDSKKMFFVDPLLPVRY